GNNPDHRPDYRRSGRCSLAVRRENLGSPDNAATDRRTSGPRGCWTNTLTSVHIQSTRRAISNDWSVDAAPYLTATLCVTRDPESGIQKKWYPEHGHLNIGT